MPKVQIPSSQKSRDKLTGRGEHQNTIVTPFGNIHITSTDTKSFRILEFGLALPPLVKWMQVLAIFVEHQDLIFLVVNYIANSFLGS